MSNWPAMIQWCEMASPFANRRPVLGANLYEVTAPQPETRYTLSGAWRGILEMRDNGEWHGTLEPTLDYEARGFASLYIFVPSGGDFNVATLSLPGLDAGWGEAQQRQPAGDRDPTELRSPTQTSSRVPSNMTHSR